MLKKLFTFFAALTLSVGLWATNSVITFTSTDKLYPGDLNELRDDIMDGDGAKWAAFKAQYLEFAGIEDPYELEMWGIGLFNPNAFLDANDQVLNYTYNYDESTLAGTITFAGELVTMAFAFARCSSLTSIILPEGLTSLEDGSFSFCSSLASVTLPESLTTIDNGVFQGCSSLASISIPANVTEIGYGAFMDCSGLTDFYVAMTTPPTTGGNVFLYASIGTATLHVPTGSLSLYQTADQWEDFGEIKDDVVLPPAVGDQFVDETSGLKFEITAIDPTATVKVIENDYEGTSYTIPASVTYKDVEFAITEIGEWAFGYCNNLTTITFAEGSQVTTIGDNAFNETESLTSIILPSSVITIGIGAFMGCNELPSINLASVTTIGELAFSRCELLSSLDIPASVTTIGEGAFEGCWLLTDITVHWTDAAQLPEMDVNVFADIAGGDAPQYATLHVPAGSASVYDVAPWNTFGTIDDPQFVLPNKTTGQYATICLPKPIASVTNGVLYKISYGNTYEVHFVEETNFTADPAGTPYLVQAEADGDIVFTMADAEPVTAPVGVEAANGFVASLQEELQDIPEGYNYLLVSGGALHSAGANCHLSKNHAYIYVDYVPATAPAHQGAPRRVVLYNADAQTPTDIETVHDAQCTMHDGKYIINGLFVIVKDGKTYNALGM